MCSSDLYSNGIFLLRPRRLLNLQPAHAERGLYPNAAEGAERKQRAQQPQHRLEKVYNIVCKKPIP